MNIIRSRKSVIMLLALFVLPLCPPSYTQSEFDSNSTSNLQKSLSDAIEINDETIRLFNADICEHFPETEWDTPLKKKVLSQSQEYKEKQNEIDTLKVEALKKRYYAVLILKEDAGYSLRFRQFLVLIKRFLYNIPSNKTVKGHIIQACEDFYFTNLPAKSYILNEKDGNRLKTNEYFADLFPDQYVYINIPMEEKAALLIEKNIEDSKLYLVFRITNQTRTIQYDNPLDKPKKFIVANMERIIIGNPTSEEVYFEKGY